MTHFRRNPTSSLAGSSARREEHVHAFLSKLDEQPVEKLQQLFTMVYTEYLRNLKQIQVLNAQLHGTRTQLNEVSRRAMLAAQVLQPIVQQRETTMPTTPTTLPQQMPFNFLHPMPMSQSGMAPMSEAPRRDGHPPVQEPHSGGAMLDDSMQQLHQLLIMNMGGGHNAPMTSAMDGSQTAPSGAGTSPKADGSVYDQQQESDDLIQQLQNALGIRGQGGQGSGQQQQQQLAGINPSMDIQMLLQSVMPGRQSDGSMGGGGPDFSNPL